MKWGVIRSKRELKKSGVDKKTAKEQIAFERKTQNNWYKSYNKATDKFNKDIERINDKYSDVNLFKNPNSKRARAYVSEVDKMWRKYYSDALIKDFGSEPVNKGRDWVNGAPFMDNYLYF